MASAFAFFAEPVSGKRFIGPSYLAPLLGILCVVGWLGVAGCVTPGQDTARDAGPDISEYVWPLPPERPRIKFMRVVQSKRDVEAGAGLSIADVLLGAKEQPTQGFKKPYAVHADKQGRLFVTDTGWGKMLVFDRVNKKFSVWGESGKGQMSKPVGVTSDDQGRVYVTDAIQKRVIVFDRDGKFLYAAGREGELERPVGVVFNEERDQIYVVDAKKDQIAVFDTQGNLVSTIGGPGVEPGQFNLPTNLAEDGDGNLYVLDSMNFRVQVLDPDGNVITTVGRIGDGPGYMARPKGVAVDSDGNIYVTDAAFNNFQIFNREGELLLYVGSMGRRPGQFWLPAGAFVDQNDRLYVADQYNYRIQVFQYLRGEGVEQTQVAVEPKEAAKPAE